MLSGPKLWYAETLSMIWGLKLRHVSDNAFDHIHIQWRKSGLNSIKRLTKWKSFCHIYFIFFYKIRFNSFDSLFVDVSFDSNYVNIRKSIELHNFPLPWIVAAAASRWKLSKSLDILSWKVVSFMKLREREKKHNYIQLGSHYYSL